MQPRLLLMWLVWVVHDLVVEAGNLQRPFNNTISAVFVFGDSTVDSGNNNFVSTPFRCNFPPYGTNFAHRTPTGRFTDGRLVTDFIAAYVGIKEYVPPYLEPKLSIEELMSGVSFASAASGFDPLTPQLLSTIPMEKQVEYFRDYKRRMEVAIGKEATKSVISKAAYLVSAGTNDVVLNYYGTPFRRNTYDIHAYLQFLLHNAQNFIQELMKAGAEVIAVVGMPPIGCLPIAITAASGVEALGRRPCIHSLSSLALDYNEKLQNTVLANMRRQYSGATLIYADVFKPLNDLIHNPSHFGLDVVNAGCCGSGLVEAGVLCSPESSVCENASKYVFFDSVHPTEAAYYYIFHTIRPLIDSFLKNITTSN